MITDMNTRDPFEVYALCEYTHAVVWSEMFIKDAQERSRVNPTDPHLDTLDTLASQYLDTADRFVKHISTEICLEITRAAMRGEITPRETLAMTKMGCLPGGYWMWRV